MNWFFCIAAWTGAVPRKSRNACAEARFVLPAITPAAKTLR
jgi:hypothetical protein